MIGCECLGHLDQNRVELNVRHGREQGPSRVSCGQALIKRGNSTMPESVMDRHPLKGGDSAVPVHDWVRFDSACP